MIYFKKIEKDDFYFLRYLEIFWQSSIKISNFYNYRINQNKISLHNLRYKLDYFRNILGILLDKRHSNYNELSAIGSRRGDVLHFPYIIHDMFNRSSLENGQLGEDPALLPLSRRQRLSGEPGKKTDHTRVIEDSLSLPRDFALRVLQQPCINVAQ